ncbi:MAG TPA: alpha/beta hydrolase [bacterium]|nr:alpha/beta hydrolase [bacterium]
MPSTRGGDEGSRRGVELHYEEAGSGPPCVLVHGGPGMSHPQMLGAFAPLGDRLRLIAYEHRGHGESSRAPVETYTQRQLAEDLHGFCRALGIERPLVLGTSAGGFVSLLYAGRYPGEPRALMLIGTSASRGFMARATANMRRLGTPAMQEAYRALWDGSLADPAAFRRAFETILPMYYYDRRRCPANLAGQRFDPETRRALIRDYAAYDARADLAAVRVPTFVAVGRHDWICPVEESVEIAGLIPGAELHVFERSGHSPHVEEPAALLAALGAFLERVLDPGVDRPGETWT